MYGGVSWVNASGCVDNYKNLVSVVRDATYRLSGESCCSLELSWLVIEGSGENAVDLSGDKLWSDVRDSVDGKTSDCEVLDGHRCGLQLVLDDVIGFENGAEQSFLIYYWPRGKVGTSADGFVKDERGGAHGGSPGYEDTQVLGDRPACCDVVSEKLLTVWGFGVIRIKACAVEPEVYPRVVVVPGEIDFSVVG